MSHDLRLGREQRRRFRRILASTLVGNMLEFYDLFIYGIFAAILAKAFFPTGDAYTAMLATAATFGISYFIRPLGAIVIGGHADRHGRKSAMMLTIWLMGLGTLVIACAPSYAMLGAGGTLILVLGKILQGFSAGGEFGSTVSFVTEHAPSGMKGYFASYQVVGIGLATGLASIVGLGTTHLMTPETLLSWGWRVPFMIGLAIVPFGYWIRRRVDETPEFEASRHERSPLRETLATAKSRIAAAIGLYSLAASTNYLLGVFVPLYAQKVLGLSPADSMLGAIGYAVAQIFLPPVFGALSDRVGRLALITAGTLLTLALTMPAFYLMVAQPTVGVYVLCITGLTACVMVFQGAMPAFVAELFPHGMRTTCIAIVHNLTFAVFGGLSLMICTWIANETGSKFVPAWYVMVTAAVALTCILWFRLRYQPAPIEKNSLNNA
ncbi:MFS transporter [Burkholderia gladioli]|uniref:MFS transporter n=1 Tax=Burkholderia gladioli TaxID=28095 RepID=UPI000F549E05|nr:MFS transporter [Burkholderia gladioli]MBJ9673452.1 MFS transporter [Burkholderia gladioli]MBU9274185.1 MFS transporter [Burkholderia gladioli]MBU9682575.1 MFS transporter [Burkholderia gladioli]MDN7459547.1 MFS transporter [Burkholderia gladioli]MDN7808394.1 MFS transporter [Burkholderia gladioli]